MDDLIAVAKITSVHGIRGLVKIFPNLENPEDIFSYNLYDSRGEAIKLGKSFTKKNHLIVKYNDISDRNDAEKLVNQQIYIKKEDLPETDEDEFYYEDLVGMQVLKSSSNDDFGIVTAMMNYGAGDIIEIELSDSKKKQLFSFDEQNFPEINPEEGIIYINPPEIIMGKKQED